MTQKVAPLIDMETELDTINGGVDWTRLDGKVVAITGATGLIGSYLVELLLRKNVTGSTHVDVIAVGRSLDRLNTRFARYGTRADLRLLESSIGLPSGTRADFIVHCGGNATPATINGDPVGTMDANFNGMKAILDYARTEGVARVLYVSSSEIYGHVAPESPALRESDLGYVDILATRSSYPSSKRATETLCAAYADQYAVDVVISRPGYIFGPTIGSWDNRVVPQFMTNALAGETIVMKSDGTRERSYCYVADSATGLLVTLLNGETGHAYNIAHDASNATIGDIASIVAGLGATTVRFDLSGENTTADRPVDRVLLDASKLEALGWQPQFDIAAGLTATYEHLASKPV
ncbi:NAD-dependent epimerase/dehydratase family protein [Agreia sp. PsM10]|uniref:NAD-dependent epimerase/dehydratase family protein n=1 Tax=Agreia sp. PsM10 TaxID=3030533 RepID=UPI00263BB9DE|nr:NAD-dependent epimerase/dehydratase family protein [Agreia sp. PsM10]MDN4641982.1 NAD-dependent epimerase/dehydratase family protein [Agreia sp. PsM10]